MSTLADALDRLLLDACPPARVRDIERGRHALPVPMAQTMAARALQSEQLPRELGAVLTAAQMVGALERVLDMTVTFAQQRQQFGRAIGSFQAIQHQLAVMAEQVAAARMEAQIGCQAEG